MCGDCEDQTPVWPEPFCHLTQHVSFIGDVLENIESDDDVERLDWVELRRVPGGHPQPSATPRGLRRLAAEFESLDAATPCGHPLQHPKDVSTPAPDLQDTKAHGEPFECARYERRNGLVPCAEPEVSIFRCQEPLDTVGVERRPVALDLALKRRRLHVQKVGVCGSVGGDPPPVSTPSAASAIPAQK